MNVEEPARDKAAAVTCTSEDGKWTALLQCFFQHSDRSKHFTLQFYIHPFSRAHILTE